ncbi:hypothetical protein [Hyphomicrobium sp. ghe19]|uniref:hypothetical protein n=1 Tax=Hyphomicrobium sp. ghe19 TaxID=2682968 RepID=UPI00136768E2|nr:hypothetical protein HYPP_01525 [Hyphomicrobium sp. ghe19]
MSIVPLSLTNKSNPARFKQGGSAQLLNCYVEEIGKEGKVPWAIYASDGLQGLLQVQGGNGGCRAGIAVDGVLYFVCGTQLHTFQLNGTDTLIGSMNIDIAAPVFIQRNRRVPPDVMVVCGGLGYYSRAGVLSQITDPDFLAAITMDFSDGYFVISSALSQWAIGSIDDAANWDGLDVATADSNPDSLVRVGAMQGNVMLFGERSTEIWSDVGNADFAYTRGPVLEIGMLPGASNSLATVEQSLCWVAHDRTVRMLGQGYDAQRISTAAVERDIQSVEDPSKINATSWVSNGHTFYKITCPDWTWVYDTTVSAKFGEPVWHKRQTNGRPDWRVSFVVQLGEKLIAGDADRPILYEMSPAFFDDAGDPLISTVVLPPVHAFPYKTTHHALYIDAERNVGSGQGRPQDVDPEMIVDWSDDDGNTFKTPRTISLGQQGSKLKRIQPLMRLGQAGPNGRVYRASWSAKVARALYQCSADIEKNTV